MYMETKVKEVVKDLASDKPVAAVKAAEKIMEDVGYKKTKFKMKIEPKKTVTVDLSSIRPEVIFTGEGWCAVDIKMCYAAIVRKFKENQREIILKGV